MANSIIQGEFELYYFRCGCSESVEEDGIKS